LFRGSWCHFFSRVSRLKVPIIAVFVLLALNAQALPVSLVPIHGFSEATNGDKPGANLVFGADGALYGTAASGGTNFYGSVFKINRDGSGFQLLHLFVNNGNDGVLDGFSGGDRGKLILGADHLLYGATPRGGVVGVPGLGTIYKMTGDGGTYQVIHQFD